MAQSLEEILGKAINSTKDLRNEINALRDSLVSVEQGSEEWQQTATKLTAAQERLSSITQAGKTSIDAAEDSIVGLERQYKALYNTYKLLTEEQRKSDFGKNMGKSLEELSSKLNSTKKDVGNFKDNIGRYAQSSMEAFNQLGISVGALNGPMKLATMGLDGLGTSFKSLTKTLLANPITWIVVAFKALSAVVKNVKEAINNNEEAQRSLSVAMSAFQPVLDKISNMWDKLGIAVVNGIGKMGNAFNKLRVFGAKITDGLGITDGKTESVQEEIDLYKQLAEAKNRLEIEARDQSVQNEEDMARVRELQAEAMATDNQAEKLAKLKESKELLEKVTQRRIKLAEDELKVMEEEAKLTANSKEDNDEIAAKKKELNSIRRDAASQTKELNSQITNLTTAIKKQTTATENQTNADEKASEASKKLYESKLEEIEEWEKGSVKILEEEYETYKAIYEKMDGVRDEDLEKLKEYYDEKIKKAKAAEEKERIEKIHAPIREQIAIGGLEYENKSLKNIANAGTGRLDEAKLIAEEEELYRTWLGEKLTLLETELSAETLNVQQKLEIEREYWGVKAELRDMDFEQAERLREFEDKNKERTINMISDIGSLTNTFNELTSTISSLTKAEIENGNLSEREIKKKQRNLKTLEEIQLGIAIAAIAADTAAGIMGIWRSYAMEKALNAQAAAVAGPGAPVTKEVLDAKSLASAILQTTGLAVAGGSQIAAAAGGYISNVKAINNMNASSGTEVASVTPAKIDSSSYSYTRQLQTDEEVKQSQQPIWVSVVDIENGLNKVQVINSEITF